MNTHMLHYTLIHLICIHAHVYICSLAGEILKIVDEELGSRPYIIQQGIQVRMCVYIYCTCTGICDTSIKIVYVYEEYTVYVH